MSHFAVLVCVPGNLDLSELGSYLDQVMHRWDEHRTVDPYPVWEASSPEQFWWVQHVRNHPAATNRWSRLLGEHPDWETVARLYNKWSRTEYSGDYEPLHYDPDTGLVHTLRTYNPESKWDYWSIGASLRGYFPVKEHAFDHSALIRAHADPAGRRAGVNCDGGPIRLLDLDRMRENAQQAARTRYTTWQNLAAAHPPAQGWGHFAGLASAGTISWDQARHAYYSQPLIMEAAAKHLAGSRCPAEEFATTLDSYLDQARHAAVPGYALVTLERAWVAPGQMGWFGLTSDTAQQRAAYLAEANSYLDQLDPATILVILDCHI